MILCLQSGGSNDGASDSGSDAGSGSDKDPESDASDGRSGSGSDSDGDSPHTDSLDTAVPKGQKRSKPAKAAKAGRGKSNDTESRERAAFKKLKDINLDSSDDDDVPSHAEAATAGNVSDSENSSGDSEPAATHSPPSGPMIMHMKGDRCSALAFVRISNVTECSERAEWGRVHGLPTPHGVYPTVNPPRTDVGYGLAHQIIWSSDDCCVTPETRGEIIGYSTA